MGYINLKGTNIRNSLRNVSCARVLSNVKFILVLLFISPDGTLMSVKKR